MVTVGMYYIVQLNKGKSFKQNFCSDIEKGDTVGHKIRFYNHELNFFYAYGLPLLF